MRKTTMDSLDEIKQSAKREDPFRIPDDDIQFDNIQGQLKSDVPRLLMPSMNYDSKKTSWQDLAESIIAPYSNVVQDCIHTLADEKKKEEKYFHIARSNFHDIKLYRNERIYGKKINASRNWKYKKTY